jgi:hypothetical protein
VNAKQNSEGETMTRASNPSNQQQAIR